MRKTVKNPQSYRSKVRTWDGIRGKICLRIGVNILILANSSAKSSIVSLFSRARHFQAIGTKFFIISLTLWYEKMTSFMNSFFPRSTQEKRFMSKLREDISNNPNAFILCLMKTQVIFSGSDIFFWNSSNCSRFLGSSRIICWMKPVFL